MPVEDCQRDGLPGKRCGQQGRCYTYGDDERADVRTVGDAFKKACAQCAAMGEPCMEQDA